jgi:hypothetical protein
MKVVEGEIVQTGIPSVYKICVIAHIVAAKAAPTSARTSSEEEVDSRFNASFLA